MIGPLVKVGLGRLWLGGLLVGLLAVIAVACGGDEEAPPPTPTPAITPAAGAISAQIVTSELVVGRNRFAVGLVDQEAGAPVLRAQVHFRFFKLLDDQVEPRFEDDADFVGFETFYIDDTTKQKVVTGETGVYVSYLDFDSTGDWGVEVTGTRNGEALAPLRVGFPVLEKGEALALGDPAPRSQQLTTKDVDISEIDTSFPPRTHMHDTSIADAIASGKPVVVAFATPSFCETRTCGPVMETVMDPLYDRYKEQAIFIHIEPYFLKEARDGIGLCSVPVFNLELARQGLGEGPGPCPALSAEQLPPPSESWNLTTEPVLFIIARQGVIAAKFEAIVGPQEVEAALQQVLTAGGQIGY